MMKAGMVIVVSAILVLVLVVMMGQATKSGNVQHSAPIPSSDQYVYNPIKSKALESNTLIAYTPALTTYLPLVASNYPRSVYQWLYLQQDNTTGLLPSQQDTLASTYNNALAVMVFAKNPGDSAKAKRILDFFRNRASEFYDGQCDDFSSPCSETVPCNESTSCGFFQYRSSKTGVPSENANRWMGDNAWLLMAIRHYQAATGDTDYEAMAQAIVRLLKSFQKPEGCIASGWENGDAGFNGNCIAEGNLDAYKALMLYGETTVAQAVKDWLDFTDLGWKDGPLDLHSWRVPSLGKEYGFCLPDTERIDDETIRYKSTVDYNSSIVTGFLHIPAAQYLAECQMSDNIWVEGTGQMAVSFCKAGYEEQWEFYLGELEKLLFEPQVVTYTQALPFLALPDPNCHSWADRSKGHVAPVSWYIFAKQRVDPFDGVVMNCSSQRQNPIARIEAENYDDASDNVRGDDTGQVYEGKAIHIGGDNDVPGDESGWVEYIFNVLIPINDATIRMRYADDVKGDTISLLLDDVPILSFNSEDTGTWENYTQTNPISVGSGIDPGLHILRVEVTDSGTYGLTVDNFRIGEGLQQ